MLLFDKMRNKKREEDHQEYEQVPETYREMVEKIEKGDFQEALRLAQMLKKQGAKEHHSKQGPLYAALYRRYAPC